MATTAPAARLNENSTKFPQHTYVSLDLPSAAEQSERDPGSFLAQHAAPLLRATLWFYRDAQQREVDFVIAAGNERHLVEAKWTENPSTRDSQDLQMVAQTLLTRGAAPSVHASIVCRTPHLSVLADGTRVFDLQELSR